MEEIRSAVAGVQCHGEMCMCSMEKKESAAAGVQCHDVLRDYAAVVCNTTVSSRLLAGHFQVRSAGEGG